MRGLDREIIFPHSGIGWLMSLGTFVDKVDWKFALVLALHLMAVGVMYGRITSEVSNISAIAIESKLAIDGIRRTVGSIEVGLASLEAGRGELSRRVDRLEAEAWGREKRK